MKSLRSSSHFCKGHGSNVVKFPVTSRKAAAERWRGAPIGLVPAEVLASVWEARRLKEDPAAAFAATVARCRETIAAARNGGR